MKAWQIDNTPLTVVADPGLDDLLALALLDKLTPRSEKSLVVTYGNMPVQVTLKNARDFVAASPGQWLCRGGAQQPLKRASAEAWIDGDQGENGLWDIRPTVKATYVEKPHVVKSGKRVISLATLTEVKSLMSTGDVSELLIMGGIFDRFKENGRPAELNVRLDPEAAKWVFENLNGIETRVVPAEVAFDVVWTRDMVQTIPESNALNLWLKQVLLAGFDSGRYKHGNELYDPLAVFLAFYPELAQWRRSGIEVLVKGPERGVTVLSKRNPPCEIAVKVLDPQVVAVRLFRAIFFGELS